jgi:hypothetical protein
MAVKGKHRKTSRIRRTKKRHTRRRQTRNKRKACMLGGNYEKDVTTQTFQGFPMKKSNEVVTSVPGRGVMSVSAYKNLMADEERNGFDFYD